MRNPDRDIEEDTRGPRHCLPTPWTTGLNEPKNSLGVELPAATDFAGYVAPDETVRAGQVAR
jgi:hypothetical protein